MSKTNGKGNGKPRKNGKQTTSPKKGSWCKLFLETLAESANIVHSAGKAGIASSTAYEWAKLHPDFQAEWNEALKQGIASLEQECRRRAMVGTQRGVYHKGEKVETITEYSDTLAIFLLKAHRPDIYRERIDVNQKHSGDVELRVAGMTPQEARDAVVERLQGLLPERN